MYAFNWTANNDYSRYYAETADPRICLVIERSDDTLAPEGDGYSPAFSIEYTGWQYRSSPIGSTDYEELGEAYADALTHFGGNREDLARRFLRAFHGATVTDLSSGSDQGARNVMIRSEHWAESVGAPADLAHDESVTGDRDAWNAFIDGEVYGIGYAVFPARVTTETPVDIESDDWTIEMESWGYYGADWAKAAAAECEEWPALPTMLPIEAA